jgi:hypothetical protein
MIKVLEKLGIEGMHLNVIKAIYNKTIANIVLNREKLNPFPLKSRTSQYCLLSPLLFNTLLEFLGISIGKTNNRNANRKGRSKIISIHRRYDTILKDPKDACKKLSDLINT